MANEGTQRRNNHEFNAEGQGMGTMLHVNVEEHSTRNNNHVTNSGLLEACQVLQQVVDEMRQIGGNPLVNTNVQEVVNEEASAERWWKLLSMKWKWKWKWEGLTLTWENFKRKFTNKYVPAVTQEKREVNFIKFEQQNMSVSVYESQFTDLARFFPHLVDTEERKVRKFVKGLNKDLQDKLIQLQLQTYMAVVDITLAIENDLEE
ncbi:hypothetical protein RJ640_007809 [Escallonia rubra]|uniref:Retrotransposon gag domain-containing protein n=1 Tax=Escallonia rubra TaxID=112253 RepID=A0AA88UHP9_9ASTE|nr:hypothetical protein RJ640_007809 [Escallonia rubra]